MLYVKKDLSIRFRAHSGQCNFLLAERTTFKAQEVHSIDRASSIILLVRAIAILTTSLFFPGHLDLDSYTSKST
jgi:hypothetical protein